MEVSSMVQREKQKNKNGVGKKTYVYYLQNGNSL